MTKLAAAALSLFLVSSPSQASTTAVTQAQESPKRSVLKTPMRTKSVLARVVPKAQRRLLITNDASDGNDGPPGSDELDLQSPYRRPELVKDVDVDPELSDYIRTRLLVARLRALQKYQEVWGNSPVTQL